MKSDDCLFCKIVSETIPAKKRYEDQEFLAIDDIAHDAPVHVLVFPKKHLLNLSVVDSGLAGRLQTTLPKIAIKLGLGSNYQISLNAGKYQEIPHLHYHLKGGEK